jgi:hypothetical protein
MSDIANQKSYAQQQFELLKVTKANNQMNVQFHPETGEELEAKGESWYNHRFVEMTEEMLEHEHSFKNAAGLKPGDLIINYFDLNNRPVTFKNSAGNPKPYRIVRLSDPPMIDGKDKRYHFVSGAERAYPYIPFGVAQKYHKGEKFSTLVITEGAKKSFYADQFGAPVIAFGSITQHTDKKTKKMHSEVLKIIDRCEVRNVIMLYDGDCANISTKDLQEQKDISRRPMQFFKSAKRIRELLEPIMKDKDGALQFHFGSILSSELPDEPKGLDDALMVMEADDKHHEFLEDLLDCSVKSPRWFKRIDMTYGGDFALNAFLGLASVEGFITMHENLIQKKDFKYRGNFYSWDGKNDKWMVKIPAEAENYMRVGDDYYEHVEVPDAHGNVEPQIKRRLKSTIIDDHGKNFIQHIEKFKTFITVPNHKTYDKAINGCWNLYQPLSHGPEEGSCENILNLVKHIFQDYYEVGLDYIKLLYEKPTQYLPILIMVSKENQTGKSTFIKLLKMIFETNMTIISNADLSNNFNSHWASKLIIACEETLLEKKQIVEKIKGLSTQDKIQMEAKGRDQNELSFFGKFVFASNNERDAIYITPFDTRYFVLKVPKIEKKIYNLDKIMREEIPGFLDFLEKRKMKYPEKQDRMWFPYEAYRTKAIDQMIEHSKPSVVKQIHDKIKDLFECDQKLTEIHMDLVTIRNEFFGKTRFEEHYVREGLRDHIPCIKIQYFEHKGRKYNNMQGGVPPGAKKLSESWRFKFPRKVEAQDPNTGELEIQVKLISKTGRPYMFKREDFIKKELIIKIEKQ